MGGGIHPPVDDIPGRLIGERVGVAAYEAAVPYFNLEAVQTETVPAAVFSLHPNPVNAGGVIQLDLPENSQVIITTYDLLGKPIQQGVVTNATWTAPKQSGIYLIEIRDGSDRKVQRLVVD